MSCFTCKPKVKKSPPRNMSPLTELILRQHVLSSYPIIANKSLNETRRKLNASIKKEIIKKTLKSCNLRGANIQAVLNLQKQTARTSARKTTRRSAPKSKGSTRI